MAENGRKPTEIDKLPPGRSSFHTVWTRCSHWDCTRATCRPRATLRKFPDISDLFLHGRVLSWFRVLS